jgi:hypothetical protein
MEKMFCANSNQKRIGWLHKSEKINFKTNIVAGDRGTLQRDKKLAPPRRYHNYKPICTLQQSHRVCETKSDSKNLKGAMDSSILIV